MKLFPELRCAGHALPLAPVPGGGGEWSVLACQRGCRVPVVGGIPRFVDSSNYASAFGMQWNKFRKTQLDSHTGTNISRARLQGVLGSPLDVLRGKSVLEVGCGAGRFTELMLAAGARVFACDLSSAVEANYDNCHRWPDYFVCQADARHVPVSPKSFDYVLCIGVIQHTSSPEETIAALAGYVRPGGMLVIDHYRRGAESKFLHRNLRRLLLRLPARVATPLTLAAARALLPLHKITWNRRRGIWRLRLLLIRHSPLIDYWDVFPQLGKRMLSEWAVLDTHDSLTDYYKHLRSVEEIEGCMRSCGLAELEVYYGGNGVEARGKMPVVASEQEERGAA